MSAPITRAQLEQHATLSAMLGIREVMFAPSAHVLGELRQLPGARYHAEPRYSTESGEGWQLMEWVRVEVEGVTFSAYALRAATLEEINSAYNGDGPAPKHLKLVP